MLQLKHISLTAPEDGKKVILHDIDLTVGENKFVVVTGPNGGGKSTLAKVIAGIMTPESGQVLLDGTDITGHNITQRASEGITFAFQQPVRFKGITVRDLIITAAGHQLDEPEICGYLHQVGLCPRDYIDREVNQSLSGGEIKRIEIVMAMARKTKLTIFDEPEAGIDLWSFTNLIDVFKQLRQQVSGSILIISHQERILEIADEIVVLADGHITAHGPREEILPALLDTEGGNCAYCPRTGREA